MRIEPHIHHTAAHRDDRTSSRWHMPGVWQRPDLRYLKAADEHGVIATASAADLALGDTLMLVPGHCDPTVNLYDELVCFRGDTVAAIWPIAARGALL